MMGSNTIDVSDATAGVEVTNRAKAVLVGFRLTAGELWAPGGPQCPSLWPLVKSNQEGNVEKGQIQGRNARL
ncbi:MAG TPA: hypothetical protein VJ870_09195 [Amycolatopsis sp.]|nr:hypothetical protein [Amycolatopsis sp.]